MTTKMTVRLVEMTNADPEFYRLIGPFLARRTVVREIGGPIWDDDGMRWFIVLAHKTVVGFAALRDRTDSQKQHIVEFDNAYVVPTYREQGIYHLLIMARLAACPVDAVLRAVVNQHSRHEFLCQGFTVRRERGAAFTEVERRKETPDVVTTPH